MKKILLAICLASTLSSFANAQNKLIGAESFNITVPNNYERTTGNSSIANVQWENLDAGIFGYVFYEHKDDLEKNDVKFDISTYAESALDTYNQLPKYKLINSKLFKTSNGIETAQKEFSYYDETNDITFRMLLNIYKTKEFMYVMMNYANINNFEKERKNIDSIVNSIQF